MRRTNAHPMCSSRTMMPNDHRPSNGRNPDDRSDFLFICFFFLFPFFSIYTSFLHSFLTPISSFPNSILDYSRKMNSGDDLTTSEGEGPEANCTQEVSPPRSWRSCPTSLDLACSVQCNKVKQRHQRHAHTASLQRTMQWQQPDHWVHCQLMPGSYGVLFGWWYIPARWPLFMKTITCPMDPKRALFA